MVILCYRYRYRYRCVIKFMAASRLLVKINYFAAGTMAIVPRDCFRPMTIDFTAGRPAAF